MRVYSAVIERCPQTGLFVGFVPGFSGAHSQGETLNVLHRNLEEVITTLLEDGEPQLESEFVGIQNVEVASGWAASRLSSRERLLLFSMKLRTFMHLIAVESPTPRVAFALRAEPTQFGDLLRQLIRAR